MSGESVVVGAVILVAVGYAIGISIGYMVGHADGEDSVVRKIISNMGNVRKGNT